MDRRNFYYKQRVTEAELDSAFDDAEGGVWNLVKDIGMLGVVTGAEVIENAPTNLTVDVLGPATCYDQAGERIYWGITQDLDCSVDYLGNPTVPTVAGEKVWISIHARFARNLQDLRTDGNGDPVYWIRGEYFELRVVAGTPAGGGAHTRPAKPTDAILLADIELSQGQTSIVNANISTSRRDDFQWTTGSNIGIDDSGWANLGPAADVQGAFDSVDAVVLDRDATGDITEDIIPAALGQFLGASGSAWDAYLRNVSLSGAISPTADGIAVGDASNRIDAHILTGVCYGVLRPDATGRSLGDATRRWDAYLEDVQMYGDLGFAVAGKTIGQSGALAPSAILNQLTVEGSLQANLDAGGYVIKNAVVGDTSNPTDGSVLDRTGTHRWNTSAAMSLSCTPGDASYDDTYWGEHGDYLEANPSDVSGVVCFWLGRLPDGCEINAYSAIWFQGADQAIDMKASLEYFNPVSGTWTVVHSGFFCDTFGSWTVDSQSGLSHTVGRGAGNYAVRVHGCDTGIAKVRAVTIDIAVTNLFTVAGQTI